MKEIMHKSVLLQEVIESLDPRPGQVFIDATIGFGGHAEAILEAIGPNGKLLGLDQDEEALSWLKTNLEPKYPNLILEKANFSEISEVAAGKGFTGVNGILADIGVSSYQLDRPERGFSLKNAGPLDMRMDTTQDLTAQGIVADYSEQELVRIFQEYGEERLSKTVAKAIVEARARKALETTQELADLVAMVYLSKGVNKGKIHPATRVFQALRIEVNDELGNLEKFLPQAIELLDREGKLAMIAFHSLEDRIVKQYFQKESKDCICPPELPKCICEHKKKIKIIAKKPIIATEQELKDNPRARSAKLRVAEKIG